MTAAYLTTGSIGSHVARWRRLRANGWRNRKQDTTLHMYRAWRPPNTFKTMIDRALTAQERPYLAFAIRSSSGLGKSYGHVGEALQALLTHSQRERFVFSTPEEALRLIKLA